MKWPPLIDSSHLPRWVIARDVLATLAAWAMLLYFVQDMLRMAVYWVLAVLGFSFAPPWEPGEMWRDTLPFLKLVALMASWLTVFSVVRWRVLTSRQWVASQPDPLPPTIQADAFGLSHDALARLRGAASATIHGIDQASGRAGAGTVVRTEPNSQTG